MIFVVAFMGDDFVESFLPDDFARVAVDAKDG